MTAETIRPITPAQLRLLTHHRLFPGDASFNLPVCHRLEGEVDVERLRSVLERLGREVGAFGVAFEDRDGAPASVETPSRAREFSVPVIDLPGPGRTHVVDRLARLADTPIAPQARQQVDFAVHRAADGVYVSLLFSHLVADAYTFYNFVDAVERLYRDPSGALPGLAAVHPADLVDERPADSAALEFFGRQLGGRSSLTNDRLAQPRVGGVLTGTHRRVELDDELSARIRARLAEQGTSPFAFFLAAHLVALSRLTGDRELVAGVPLGNRRGLRQRQAFGYFVNTLPLVADLTAHRTFADLVGAVHGASVGLLRHQSFDLAANLRTVAPGMQSTLLTLDNAFTYYRQPIELRIPGCSVEPLLVPRQQVKYPFGMTVEDFGGRFAVNLEYGDNRRDADPEGMLRHLLTLVAEDPETELRALPAMAPEQERRIARLIGEPEEFELPPSLAAWFERTAAAHPGRTAVQDGDESLTYAELNARANRVAHRIAEQVPGRHVAVAMRRGLDLVAVLLGVVKAGRTYVPLDPASPAARIAHIVADFPGGLPLIADQDRWPDTAPALLDSAALLAAGAEHDPAGGDRREEPAYVIFTSGSTGRPKGVQVTHANVMRLFRSAERHFGFGPDDTWCLFHSYAFDVSVWELFGALLHGGRLVVVPELTAKSPDRLLTLLATTGVTVLNQTPSAFRQLLKVLTPEHRDTLAVRHVVFAGEALSFAALRPWYEVMGERAQLANMYGITETTVHSTYHPLRAEDARRTRESVIGRPLADLTVSVVDRDLHPCPVGVPGELLVGGAGVSLGYLGRPDLTAQRFLPGEHPGERRYRSGDLGVVRPDGTLVYLGRIDRQVQLRGYRIELGEIESALLAVDGVRECVVRMAESPPGEPELVAFLAGCPIGDDAQVRAALRGLLPAYMVPARLVRLAALPLTVNGKVDDHALPWPTAAAPRTAPAGPGRGTGELVRSVWQEALPGAVIGPDDNLFDLGGSSTHVIEVFQRLQERVDTKELEIIDLFAHTTVRRLAAHLDALGVPAAAATATAGEEAVSRG
ncbi:amino acid adenylation domain-containing protein [Kitasatospora sp. NPDC048540]|uniref:non-ribosomal peptide synthetase n=1 Tax=Kitasatospora sp. NPDC048540 TaxID=3155634 RepID=UPI0033F5BF54